MNPFTGELRIIWSILVTKGKLSCFEVFKLKRIGQNVRSVIMIDDLLRSPLSKVFVLVLLLLPYFG